MLCSYKARRATIGLICTRATYLAIMVVLIHITKLTNIIQSISLNLLSCMKSTT